MDKLLETLLPISADLSLYWDKITALFPNSLLARMNETQQNTLWHEEGSVWTHTQMIYRCLGEMPEFKTLPKIQQAVVTLAALLHDIGKIHTTRLENGEWISPGHSVSGALMARELLWKNLGFSGKREYAAFREAVCMLIRYHSTPVYIQNHTEPEKRLIKLASNGELTEHFSIKLLCLLSEVNILGRKSANSQLLLKAIADCRTLAKAIGCYEKPLSSASANKNAPRVVLLSGLPGSGKDAWIQKNAGSLPIISMDGLRKEMNIAPGEKNSIISYAAQERARAYLEAGQSFLWNATNLSETTRMRLIRLFENLGAAVEVVYLETDWQETLKRNDEKPNRVPIPVLEQMLSKLSPPQRYEASRVRWCFEA